MKRYFDFWAVAVRAACPAYAKGKIGRALYFLYNLLTLKLYYTTTPKKPHTSAPLQPSHKVGKQMRVFKHSTKPNFASPSPRRPKPIDLTYLLCYIKKKNSSKKDQPSEASQTTLFRCNLGYRHGRTHTLLRRAQSVANRSYTVTQSGGQSHRP